jgi:signal peptidase I
MNILRRLGAFFLDVFQVIVFAISLFLFMYLLLFQPHKVKGDSMQPNYPNAEYLLTDKVTYRFNEPKRGDVIVFKPPPAPEDEYIKRIIGLPGDRVKVEGGKVYINSKVLREDYLSSTLYTSGGTFLPDGDEITVPKDNYFVMGDNRPYSSDSRSWGFVPKANITGRAWFIYWPPNKIGAAAKINYNL